MKADAFKDQARQWIERLVELKTDRGKLADLRCWFRDASRPRAYQTLIGLRGSLDDDAFNTVAALYAHHPEHREGAGNLGAILHRLAREHTTFEGRLRRLLCCDAAEVLNHLRSVILAAKRDGTPVDYLQLYLDLRSWAHDYWGEETRKNWATSFWQTEAAQIQA
ncbi:MAG: type I-E CRISPR-associated protein Cse2/CasB [Verrucomicrobia bacterium]|nr:type I-E CRISPR-associated protein Cse2/CasB [Verrucomicrobiota bacterium]